MLNENIVTERAEKNEHNKSNNNGEDVINVAAISLQGAAFPAEQDWWKLQQSLD